LDENKRVDNKYMLETIVIDTGIGIPRSKQKMLFKPFLEIKNNQGLIGNSNNDCIGLGLSYSHMIARRMLGDI